MSVPLWGLVGLAALVLVHVAAQSFALKASVGNRWTAGPRDVPAAPGVMAGRLARAFANLRETAPAFVALALAAELSGRVGVLVEAGVILYLAGRAAYLPAYASGLPWLRTVIWQAATLGIVLMLVGVVWP